VAGNIVAGHGRRLAAIQLGLDKVPVRVLKGYTQEEIDGLRLGDNRISSNEYDHNFLQEEINRLHQLDFEIKDLGFSDQELEFLNTDNLTEFDESVFTDDVSDAVATQKKENEKAQEETDATAVPIADAFGFKRVTVAQSRKLRGIISQIEEQHGKKGVEALFDHFQEVGL